MSVLEYTSKFNSLRTYAPTIMADDTLKLHRFKKGLSSQIQSALAIYKPTNFADLMGVAIRAEMDIKQHEEEGKNKRPLASQSSPSEQRLKRLNLSSGQSKGPSFTLPSQSIKPCSTCNFRHLGECHRISGVCFNCGKMGHRITDCPEPKKQGVVSNSVVVQNKPKENKPNAQVFAMTQKDVDNVSNVVVGTILINKITAYVLFDCGATHSFISKRFTMKLGLKAEILSEPYRVATSSNKAIKTHKLHQSCQVSIGNHTFEADLIQLNMIAFDAILGMDWLAKNHALVYCHRKSVKLQTSSQEEIIYHGKAKEKRLLLSASQIWKAMRSGDEIYLAMISEVEENTKTRLEEIPIV
ncbi:uncharacterized protein LOC122050319 [Zingiber officinale]|uniref:uncharacterized protein LOC122050319 n=1 Tax=Zingiber officinale TaxID=94328 RepID=UPI001C4D87B1|nr:uncharacterized protein LOC122050319 [Zingiber officinale]